MRKPLGAEPHNYKKDRTNQESISNSVFLKISEEDNMSSRRSIHVHGVLSFYMGAFVFNRIRSNCWETEICWGIEAHPCTYLSSSKNCV